MYDDDDNIGDYEEAYGLNDDEDDEPPRRPRRPTWYERRQALADAGIDTLEEYREFIGRRDDD